jgi:hypothetical protein
MMPKIEAKQESIMTITSEQTNCLFCEEITPIDITWQEAAPPSKCYCYSYDTSNPLTILSSMI